MMNKKILAVTIATGLLMAGALAFAASNAMNVSINNSGEAKIAGTVTAVSGSTITVSSWGGSWAVNSANAQITVNGNANGTISDVHVGDQVTVKGTASAGSLSITATAVHDGTLSVMPNTIIGAVSNLNVSAGTFTVGPRFLFMKLHGDVNVATNAQTQVFVDGNASTLANVSNGMGVIVFGTWNADHSVFTASEVRAYTKNAFGLANGKGLALGLRFKMGMDKDHE